MIFLLDTNACIAFLNGTSPEIKRRITETSPTDIFLCSIVKAELWFGVELSHPNRRIENAIRLEKFFSFLPSLPFDDSASRLYGQVRADLQKQGQPIGPNDTLIAAIALAHNATLVSNNVNEFCRVGGLSVEDWSR